MIRMKPHTSFAMLYNSCLYEEHVLKYHCLMLFPDPCFAKECSPSERCIVKSDDKTTCGKFEKL